MRETLYARVARLGRDDGQTVVEYAIASGVLIIVSVGAFRLIGPRITAAIQMAVDGFP